MSLISSQGLPVGTAERVIMFDVPDTTDGLSIHSIEPDHIIGYRADGRPIRVVAGGSEPLYDGDTGGAPQGTDQGGNPAWGEFLNVVPQEYHAQVTPILQKWDSGVNDRFNKVHSDYADFKGFKDNGITKQQLEQGLNLLNAISADPLEVWKAMKEAYKFEEEAPTGQGQQEPKVEEEPWKQQYDSVKNQLDTVSRIILQQRQAEEAAKADAALDKELSDLKTKYGAFDEEFVLSKLMVNPKTSAEEAVKAYKEWESRQQARFGPKPLFMGNGHGGLPSQMPNVKSLSDKGTRDLVADMLLAAKQAEQ